jgi:hypothetical protein
MMQANSAPTYRRADGLEVSVSDFQRIDTSRQCIAISRELKMTPHPARRGPEPRTDGLTVGTDRRTMEFAMPR